MSGDLRIQVVAVKKGFRVRVETPFGTFDSKTMPREAAYELRGLLIWTLTNLPPREDKTLCHDTFTRAHAGSVLN